MNEIRVARERIQPAIDGRESETTRDFHYFRAPKIDRETAEHDRPQYKKFKIPEARAQRPQELYYCHNCGKTMREDEVAGHDRFHKSKARRVA